jgi:hypothetical protein
MYNNKGNDYAYLGLDIPISSVNIDGTGLMLNERVRYTANNGIAIISTANSAVDGSGSVSDLITGATHGTLVKRITIKAQGNTTQGMVRIFLNVGLSTWLMNEIEIPAITQSSQDQSFSVVLDNIFYLDSLYKLKVSTENAETFIITAEGLDVSYP